MHRTVRHRAILASQVLLVIGVVFLAFVIVVPREHVGSDWSSGLTDRQSVPAMRHRLLVASQALGLTIVLSGLALIAFEVFIATDNPQHPTTVGTHVSPSQP